MLPPGRTGKIFSFESDYLVEESDLSGVWV